jgi:DNA-binding beta-propeller fold protein YncE
MVNQFSTSTLTWINCIGNGASFSGSDSTGLAGAGSLAKPRYVSLDNLGNLFIADAGTAGFADVMEYYGPTIPLIATTNVNYWTGSLSSSAVTNCVGQICNAGTTVIVANSANNRIDFYPANETTGYAGTPLSSISSDNNSSNAVAFNDPQGVAYSASTGYLYISDTGNNRIVEMTLSGSFVRILGPTIGAATLSGPTGIKLDGAQPPFVYVADTGNGRVLKLQ